MPDSPWFLLERDAALLRLRGRWSVQALAEIEPALRAALAGAAGGSQPPVRTVDAGELEHLDSAAALVLLRCLDGGPAPDLVGWPEAAARVLGQVRAARAELPAAPPAAARSLAARLAAGPARALARVGRGAAGLGTLLLGHLNFLGATLAALAAAALRPRRLRLRELTVQLEQTVLAAVPVVALVTALIGVVLAYLLGLQAEKYGANIFVVDGVGIGATREFAPIIVAVIVAGRSGAAFTAQLGAMRLTQETDAIRTLGLDVAQVLVVPRVLALVIGLPLLVFVGDVASLAGAMLVTGTMLDIGPAAFLARLREALELRHVVVGLVKAPVFALAVAVIGTRMGMSAGRDTLAIGRATTSTVVQSIVAVILLDAAFAVLLQALGW